MIDFKFVFLSLLVSFVGCTENPSVFDDREDPDGDEDADRDSAADERTEEYTLTTCEGNCVYIRTGGTGDGSDWSAALGEFPTTFTRGAIYLYAAGSYGSLDLDEPAEGTEEIRLVRATTEDHGTESGWDDVFGSGEVLFGPLTISAPSVALYGRGSTRVVGAFQGSAVDISGDDVTVSDIEVDGNFQMSGGVHSDGACTGLSITGDRVRFEDSDIHDAADDGVSLAGTDELVFRGNEIHMLHGCGTDGGCGPCYNGHSDGIEMYNVTDALLAGNFVYDMSSTAALFMGNWADELGSGPSDYCENIRMINNIFYSYETGLAAYLQDVNGLEFYNNVVWGQRQGNYGGLAIGENISGLWLYNNVILSVNTDHIGVAYDPAHHHSDYNFIGHNTTQWPLGTHDIVDPNPMFQSIPDANGAEVDAPSADAFAPADGSPLLGTGTAIPPHGALPAHDFFNQARTNLPSIGAIE